MILLLLTLAAQAAVIDLEEPPVPGEETWIVVTDQDGQPRPGVTVRATWRADLPGARETAVGITDGLGRTRWVPDRPGRVVVRADEERLAVQVAWLSPPAAVLSLLALLALAGAGGLGYGLLLRGRWRPSSRTDRS